MTLWVFSNHGYGFGEEVRDAAAAWAAARGVPCVLVLSGRRRYSRPPLAGPGLAQLHMAWRRLAQARWRHAALVASGLPPCVVDDVNAPEMFHAVAPGDWGLVAGFNQIFGAAILDRFGVLLNVHPSLLPLYRGPTPSAWCLANGEAVSGFTFHHVTARIDAGPIVHQGVVAIVPSMDTAELDGAISRAAARDLPGVLDAEFLHRGSFKPAQIDARTAYRVHVNYCGVL